MSTLQSSPTRAYALADDSFARALECTRLAEEFLFSIQRENLFWCAELESNPTITAETVMLHQMLGLELGAKKEAMTRFLREQQKTDGGWGIAANTRSDVSTTAETYLALRILGVESDDVDLIRAEKFILRSGGLENVRIFTRIFFAMFGLIPWNAIPALPPELILLPPQSAINVYSLASWARGTMIPLFVIFHYKPVFALPNGKSESNGWLDHLWLDKSDKNVPYMPSWWRLLSEKGLGFETLFGTADWALKCYEPVCFKAVRKRAVDKCVDYVLSHQEESGDWGGIFPPMINGVLALWLHGYGLDSLPVRRGLSAIDAFGWEDDRGYRVQACVSPVWDTALSMRALLDCGIAPNDPRLRNATRWLWDKQIRAEYGDWKVYRPKLKGGGWSFEYHNTWYPDVDDTAAVLLALMKQEPEVIVTEEFKNSIDWLIGMQNRDGGWAAFDVDNDKLFLNKIPFSDMDSLCDTSCPDITGRILEAFGCLMKEMERCEDVDHALRKRLWIAIERGVDYLRRTQEPNGSWFGRWGVNYVYGTSNALCGLAQTPIPAEDPMVARALYWLQDVQNKDGGWGESLKSYEVNTFIPQESTPSQTAWALMGLLSFAPPENASIARGIGWLIDNQIDAPKEKAFEGGRAVPVAGGGTWHESESTGTGFPNHFYLRYHLYRHYFPMMALGRYLRAKEP